MRLGLVTASTRGVVEPSLHRLNLEGLFETAYFADDVVDGKPHPEALLRALADLGVAPADAVYVGDTTIDLAMASAAGTPFEAVAGTTTDAAFRAAGVERVWPGVGAWADDLLGQDGPNGMIAPRRLVGWLLAPALVLTVACGLAYGEAQQVLRTAANDPQEQLAGDAARALDCRRGADEPRCAGQRRGVGGRARPRGRRDGPRAIPGGLRQLGGVLATNG